MRTYTPHCRSVPHAHICSVASRQLTDVTTSNSVVSQIVFGREIKSCAQRERRISRDLFADGAVANLLLKPKILSLWLRSDRHSLRFCAAASESVFICTSCSWSVSLGEADMLLLRPAVTDSRLLQSGPGDESQREVFKRQCPLLNVSLTFTLRSLSSLSPKRRL